MMFIFPQTEIALDFGRCLARDGTDSRPYFSFCKAWSISSLHFPSGGAM